MMALQSAVCIVKLAIYALCTVQCDMFWESWSGGSVCAAALHLTQSRLHTIAHRARNHCKIVCSLSLQPVDKGHFNFLCFSLLSQR